MSTKSFFVNQLYLIFTVHVYNKKDNTSFDKFLMLGNNLVMSFYKELSLA